MTIPVPQLLAAVRAARVSMRLRRGLRLPGQHGVQTQDLLRLGRRSQGQGLPVHGRVPTNPRYDEDLSHLQSSFGINC